MNREERLQRLDTFLSEDRICRFQWASIDDEGRGLVCLLAALSPEVAEVQDATLCPSDVMPPWLAIVTPFISDNVSEKAWPNAVRRYAALAHRWHVLSEVDWKRLEFVARTIALREVLHFSSEKAVVDVWSLCNQEASGKPVDDALWLRAREEVRQASSQTREGARVFEVAKIATIASEGTVAVMWVEAAKKSEVPGEVYDRMASVLFDAIEETLARTVGVV